MQKLLIICGLTATGKTSLGLKIAKLFPAKLISADSRQIYRHMDIGTGKDAPSKAILGYDLVTPDQDFSVNHFVTFARKRIDNLWQKNLLPIVIGGTGLYLDKLINPPASLGVPPDIKLRTTLNRFSVIRLQKKLNKISPRRFKRLNQSDVNNPRRLIRAIEILSSKQYLKTTLSPLDPNHIYWLGLKAPLKIIDKRINKRVLDRIDQGMTAEVKKLIKLYPDWSLPAFTATGYKPWRAYLETKLSKSQAIAKWQLQERQYARRQLTWFNQNPLINWFDVSHKNFKPQVVAAFKNWYSTANETNA